MYYSTLFEGRIYHYPINKYTKKGCSKMKTATAYYLCLIDTPQMTISLQAVISARGLFCCSHSFIS